MKKIISLALVILMCVGLCPFESFAEYTDVDVETNVGACIDFLEEIGVMLGYDDDTFRPDDNITRAEFAVIVARMLKIPEQIDSNDVYYIDVPASHWAAGSIEQLTNRGILSGKGKGFFGINDSITFEEAVTILLRICDYDVIAEAKGGFPNGYLQVANSDTELTKGVDSGEKFLIRKNAAMLVYNALNQPLYDIDSMKNNSAVLKAGEDTLLSRYWNIYYTEGIVNATAFGSIYGISGISEKNIDIDGRLYNTNNVDYGEYVGNYVEGYYYDIDGVETLFYIRKPQKYNETIVINYDEIVSVDEDYVISYEVDNKVKTIRLEKNLKVLYNGVGLATYTPDIFDDIYGKIEVVDVKQNGYSLVKIWDYKNYIVDVIDSKEEKIISGKYFEALDLSDNMKFVSIINADGSKADFSDIKEKSVLSVVQNGEVIRAYICDDRAEGIIDTVQSGQNKVEISGVLYNIAKDYKDEFILQFKPGSSVTLYLDIFGNVTYAKGANSEDYIFAYLIKGVIDDASEEKIMLKVFTQQGKMENIYLREKSVKIDGVSYKNKETALDALKTNGEIAPMLIRFKRNTDGEVTMIDTPKYTLGSETEYSLTENIPFRTQYKYKSDSRTIGGRGYVDASTIFFFVPTDDAVKDASAEKFQIKAFNEIGTNVFLDLVSYKTAPKVGYEQVCVVKQDLTGEISNGRSFVVIDEINKALNENDEVVNVLTVYSNGVESEIYSTEDADVDSLGLERGDMVRLALNKDGIFTGQVTSLWKAGEEKPSWAPTNDRNHIDGEYTILFGYAYEKEDGILRVAYDMGENWKQGYQAYNVKDVKMTLFDESSSGREQITSCTINDIKTYDTVGPACDRVLVQVRYSNIMGIAVIRR